MIEGWFLFDCTAWNWSKLVLVTLSCLFLLFLANLTFDSSILLQPVLFFDTSSPILLRCPYFIIPVCSLSLSASSLLPFSTSKQCFHCCSLLPLPPDLCLILSSLLFSHLIPHPPLLPSLWPTAAELKFLLEVEKLMRLVRPSRDWISIYPIIHGALLCSASVP